MAEFCVLDVETSGGLMERFPEGFRLLITGVRVGDRYGVYTANRHSLGQLQHFLHEFEGSIVTYNGAKFDIPLLNAWCQEQLGSPLRVSRHYDLMAEIVAMAGHRISLDLLCYYTFGERKVAWDHRHNDQAWRAEPNQLIDYNRVDVDLTHELFERVLRRQHLFLGDATVLLPLPH